MGKMNASSIVERDYENICVCGKNILCVRTGIKRGLGAVNIDRNPQKWLKNSHSG